LFLKGVRYMIRTMRKPKMSPEIRAYFVGMGKLGGKLGGKARAKSLTPERRKEIAQNAIKARWAKKGGLG
jgi:hypothetical protein